MKKLLFILLFLASFVSMKAQEIIIGTGSSTSSSVAFYPLYMDSWYESTYLSSEVNAAGAILSVSLQATGSSTLSCETVDIYMGHRSSGSYSSTTNWTPASELTLVYSGTNESIGSGTGGWETFNLQVPFVYNGTDNLVIVWSKHATSWTSSVTYAYTTTSDYTNLYRNTDNDASYAQHPGSASGSRGSNRPNIKLMIGNVDCMPPVGVQYSNLSSDQCDFSWSVDDGAVCNYQLKEATESWDDVSVEQTSDLTVSFTGLNPNTEYNFRIQQDCGENTSIWINKTFTTTQVPAQLPYNHDFTDEEENSQWVLTTSGTNHWFIGNGTSYLDDGMDKSLYISNDDNGTYAASSESSYIYAERFFDFGETPSSFTISADWKASGYVSGTSIYSAVLMYVRDADEATPEGAFPSYVNNYLQYSVLDNDWSHVSVQIDSISGVKKLQFFTWGYSNEDARTVPGAIDNISIEESACVTPTFSFETTDVTATLTHNGAEDGTYLLIYRVRGSSVSTNTYVNFTGSTYTISDLDPNTTYYAWLAQLCGGDTSVTNFAQTFTTQCGIFTAPYGDDFTEEPTCWFIDEDEFLYSTSGYLYSYNDTITWAVSPVIDASGLTYPYLKFSHYQTTGSGLHVYYRTDEEEDWTFLASYTASNSSFQADSLPIPFGSSTLQIGFMYDGAEGGYGYIDDFSVYDGPECPTVTAITIDNIQSDQVTISWADVSSDGYEIRYKAATDDDWTTLATSTTNSVTIDQLTPLTSYTVEIAVSCDEPTYVAISFTTTMVAVDLPYQTDFSADADRNWLLDNFTATNQWFMGTPVNYNNYSALFISSDSTNATYNNSSAGTVVALKTFNAGSSASLSISFDAWVGGESTWDYLKVFLAPASVDYSVNTTYPTYSTYTYSTYAMDFSNYQSSSSYPYRLNLTGSMIHIEEELVNPDPDGQIQLVFMWRNDGSAGTTNPSAIITNVNITSIECSAPTALATDNISSDQISFHFTPASVDDTEWEVMLITSNDTTYESIYESNYTFEDLTPDTYYTFAVRTICDVDNYSNWSPRMSVRTSCATITAPYTEDFAGFNTNPSPCWERFSGLASSIFNGGTLTSITSGWYFTSSNVFPLGHPKINIYSTSCNYWLVSPAIDLSQLTNPALSFSLALTDYGNENPIEEPTGQSDDQFMVVISTDNGATWSAANATIWNNSGTGDHAYNSISTTGEDIFISLSQYGDSTIRIAFYGESTQSNGDNDLHIANVVVDEMPGCLRPTDLAASSIGMDEATISFVPASEEDVAWEYALCTGEETPESVTPESISETTFQLSSLTTATAYVLYIRTVCNDGGYSNWSSPLHFNTQICNIADQCEYIFTLDDSFGDGWNGAYIEVKQNGITITTLTISSGSTNTVTVSLCGDLPTQLIWNKGSYDSECSFTLTGPDGSDLISQSGMSSFSTGAIIDTFTTNCSGCMAPANMAYTLSDDATSATITWDAGNEETAWVLEYQVEGESTWTTENITGTPEYTLDNLTPVTTYTVRVKSDCGDGMSGFKTISFTTPCAAEIAPYTEDFSSFSSGIGACWERFSGLASEVFAGGTLTSTTSGWGFSSSNVYPAGHPKVNIYGTSCKYWLVTPAIDLSQLSEPALMFNLALTDYNNADPIEDPTAQADDQFMVIISTDFGVTWSATNATVWNNTGTGNYAYNSISTTGENITISLSQYAGQTIRIAFYGESTVSGNGDNDLHIANVVVDEYGNIPDPTVSTGNATNIAQTAATLNGSITNPGNVNITARGFEWKAVNATDYTVVNLTGTSNTLTHNLSGLTANTAYTYKAFITFDGNTVYGDDVNFTTLDEEPGPCVAPTNLTVSDVTATSATMSWTAGGSETSWKVGYKLQSASQWQEATVQTTSYNLEGLTASSTYDVRVKALCANGESDFVTSSFTTGVGIDNITLANSISLMPNPADNFIELRVNSSVEVIEAVVYNAFGQMVQTVTLTDNHARIDLSDMASGMYFVRVNGEGVSATKKFIRK